MLGKKLGKELKPKTSFNKAITLYNDPERKLWLERRRDIGLKEIQFADAISDWYRSIMSTLPPQVRKILSTILHTYHKGITTTEIAKRTFIPAATVASPLTKLKRAKFIVGEKRSGDQRKTYYRCPDEDWLRAYVIYSDGRFMHWKLANDISLIAKPVTEFIKSIDES